MTPAHRTALALARKEVRKARTRLRIAEWDHKQAADELKIAERGLRLLRRMGK